MVHPEPLRLGILAEDAQFEDANLLRQIEDAGYAVQLFRECTQWPAERIAEACRAVDVLIMGRKSPKLPAVLAGDFGRLRWVCYFFGTIRHLIERPLIEAGLIVTNWGDEVANVAEGAMALLLAQLKQLPLLDRYARTGKDDRIGQRFRATLRGLNVGLYGYGPIGRHMARMLEPFGPRISIYDPYATKVPANITVYGSLRELFAKSEVVSIHCGLNDQTRHSVTGELLDLLPQGGIVINTARGAVVDEGALAERVAAGRLLAGVDVIENEKQWGQSPLAALPGAMLTRHMVCNGRCFPKDWSPTPRLPEFVEANLRAFAAGEPLKFVISAGEYDLKT